MVFNPSRIFFGMPNRPVILLTGGDEGFGNFGDELILQCWKDFYRPFRGIFRCPRKANSGVSPWEYSI